MDKLWGDEALLHKEDAAIADDLDVLARDVSSDLLVKTMLRAYGAASEGAQERLDEVVPGWFAASGHAGAGSAPAGPGVAKGSRKIGRRA
jgi:hypothetical protein